MKITEQSSRFDHLEKMSVSELLQHINEEDCRVAESVRKAIPQIKVLVEAIEQRMKKGGRLFYIGAWYKWKIRCARCQRIASNVWCT